MCVAVPVVVVMVFASLAPPFVRADAPPETALPTARPGSPNETLEGAWEGFVAETPARLSQIGVRLKHVGEGWEGTIDLPGAPGLPLSAIRVADARLHFELRVEDTVVVFDAEHTAETITGSVIEGERAFTFDLQKLPSYPTPADRIEAWRQDLDVVRRRFLKYDRSFGSAARRAFAQAIDRLEASLSDLNDQEVIVALSEAVALSGNAHTRLYLLRNRVELRRLPVRVYWFSDGLFVVRATPAQRDALGCRVTAVAGRDPREVRERVARLFAGNESWVDYKSPYFMTSPEILYGLRMIADMEQVPLAFDCGDRGAFERALAPLPLQRSHDPVEAWRDLSPRWRGDGGGSESVLPATGSLPLYLRDPSRYYWFEYLEESDTLYLQYNRSQNMSEGEGFEEFAARVETFVTKKPLRGFILDLRFNTGGNNGVAARFMERLVALEKEGTIGRLFVVTGRATFSAGISHAAYLKQYSDATFVGEPVGDELDTWSEGGNVVLPNSGLTVHFTNGFHSLSRVERPEFEPYLWTDLDLDDLDPDVVVRPSSRDYLSGRDPVLETIIREITDGSAETGRSASARLVELDALHRNGRKE